MSLITTYYILPTTDMKNPKKMLRDVTSLRIDGIVVHLRPETQEDDCKQYVEYL